MKHMAKHINISTKKRLILLWLFVVAASAAGISHDVKEIINYDMFMVVLSIKCVS